MQLTYDIMLDNVFFWWGFLLTNKKVKITTKNLIYQIKAQDKF